MELKNYIMNYYRKLLAAILLITSLLSCKKSFLDNVSEQATLIRQDYVTDLKTTNEYLNGVYTDMGGNLFHGYHMIYPELIADNAKPVSGSSTNVPLGIHYNWSQQADESSSAVTVSSSAVNFNGFSYGAYRVIRSASYVLEKADEYRSQDPVGADAIKGQAYAIRALSHFLLVNVFAQSYNFSSDASHPGIAYVTTSNWTMQVNNRNTVAEVYLKLISDLNNAISLLPATSSNTLVMNRNAARALLSRVYLFKGDWLLAKNLARQVGTTVPIMVTNYPAKLFTLMETEALFQLPPSTGAINGYATNFASRYYRPTIQFLATSDVATLLNEDANDARKVWVASTVVSGITQWNVIKFPTAVVPEVSGGGSYYQTILRSSEMYLAAAESYAQLNDVDSARFYLDAIRKRANPTATATTLTGNALLEAICKERRKELAFEGFRMFDLLRWKKGVNRADALSPAAQVLPYPSNKAIAPIPALDVKISGLVQNLDY